MHHKSLLICLIVLIVSIPVRQSETPAAELHLTWTDNSDNEEGFEIERETTSTFDSIAIVGDNVTTFTDWGLAPGTTYCYRVRAFSIYGYSDYSNEACATTLVTLTVIPVGSGRVTSVPVGINCPTDCSVTYLSGTIVTLTATPSPDSAFAGWSGGGCTGTGICIFNLNADTSITATFAISDSPLLLTSLVPSSALAGGAAFTLTVNGSNFSAGSVVQWNGLARTTTYMSNSQLAAVISADDIATPGTDQVTVVNSGPGGGTSNAQTFTVTPDPTAPDTIITAAPANPSNSSSASFSFTSSDADSSFQCRADGAMFAACTNPWSYSSLVNSSHTFQVRAISLAGYIDPTPASYTWKVDTRPPDTSIIAAPTNPSTNNSASFSFTASEAGSTFQCQLDGAGFAACTIPRSYSNLATGSHTFQVRAIDLVGNIDPTPASYTWTIDTTPPDTSITAAPANPSSSSSASFSFTSNEAGSSFQCQLDGASFAACTSPRSYTKLAKGSHTFQVRAIDLVGYIDPSPASYTWTIDTTSPNTSITATPANPSNSNSASFSFTSSEAGSTFQCQLDGASFAACTNPWSYSNLITGSHTFQVRAIDLAGNIDPTPASYTWTIDITSPDTSITATPANPSSSSSASFSFTSSEAGSSFQCQLDGANFAACTNPWSYSNLATGSHTFQVRAISQAGYIDPSPASYTWTIDITSPDTSITATPANPSSSSASFSFTSSEAGSSFQCQLDGASFAACTNPRSYSNLVTGSHTFQVRAIDLAGNIDPTPASYTWTIDITSPDTSITATPANPSSSSSASFSFTSSEAGSSFQCQLDGANFAACTNPWSYNNLVTGSHTFQVRAIDLVGNIDSTPASYAWTYTPVTRFPNSVAIDAGSFQGGTANNLSTDDDKYYQVNSTTSGTRITSWYGNFTSVPKNLSNLKVTYKGKNSKNCAQTISLWRWTDNSWVQLDLRTVGMSEISIANLAAAGALSEYVSGTIGNGDLRVQVRCTGGTSNFYASGNLMNIVYDTP